MPRWLLFAALLLALAAPVAAGEPALPRSLTLLSDAPLTGIDGAPAGPAKAFSAWDVVKAEPGRILAARFGPQGRAVAGRLGPRLARRSWPVLWLFQPDGLPGPWWVPATALKDTPGPRPGSPAKAGLEALGWLPAEKAVLLGGPAALHAARLARLREANLPAALKPRLAAGRIEKGDNFWEVELAWGRPQRSFMINYLSDEQHYVYLLPGGAVLLRFKGGHLDRTPPHPSLGPAKVANPSSHR